MHLKLVKVTVYPSVSVLTTFAAKLHQRHTGMAGVVTGERWLQAVFTALVTILTTLFTNQVICDSSIVISNYIVNISKLAMQYIQTT